MSKTIELCVEVKMRATNCYKVDEDKLREAYARYGFDWDEQRGPQPDSDDIERILYDIIGEGWWEDAYKYPELDEVDFHVED